MHRKCGEEDCAELSVRVLWKVGHKKCTFTLFLKEAILDKVSLCETAAVGRDMKYGIRCGGEDCTNMREILTSVQDQYNFNHLQNVHIRKR